MYASTYNHLNNSKLTYSSTSQGLAITNTVLLTVSAYWGLGRHQETLADSPQHIIFAIKWAFLAEGPNILASGFARISFAFLLLTITPPTKNKRIFLWSIIAIQFAADLAAVIVTYSQCRPLIAYWDPRVKGDCWPPTYQQYTGFTQGCKKTRPSLATWFKLTNTSHRRGC